MLRSSFQFIRCKFRRMHIEDPLTPEIFSLSQMDELVRGVLLPLPIAQSLYSSFLARPRRVLGWSRLPVILCAGFIFSFPPKWDYELFLISNKARQSKNSAPKPKDQFLQLSQVVFTVVFDLFSTVGLEKIERPRIQIYLSFGQVRREIKKKAIHSLASVKLLALTLAEKRANASAFEIGVLHLRHLRRWLCSCFWCRRWRRQRLRWNGYL